MHGREVCQKKLSRSRMHMQSDLTACPIESNALTG